jgi:hypothetical protein
VLSIGFAGCGGAKPDTDTPTSVVERFTDAYVARDFRRACEEMSSYTEVTALGQALLTDAARRRSTSGVDLDHGCPGLLRSASALDPAYVTELSKQRVENVDSSPKRVAVQTNAASWDIYRFGGRWKLASLDALIPQ